MADKQGEERTASPDSALLGEDIVSLISSRLNSIDINPPKQEILKVLSKRKKKWRKRHTRRPAYQPLDPSLREEKESIFFTVNELTSRLIQRRREGYSMARQQQREMGEYCLEAFSYWLETIKDFLQSCQSGLSTQGSSTAEKEGQTPHSLEHEQLLRDLDSAISQATAISEIQSMKHTMTPRLPPIQDRTLSGNILDASLGVFHLEELPPVPINEVPPVHTEEQLSTDETHPPVSINQEPMEINGMISNGDHVVTEYLDAQLTIGKVVSVGQDSCYKSDTEEDANNDRNACAESEDRNDPIGVRVYNESSDDTPGVGMEIVYGAASDLETGPFVVSQSHEMMLNGTNRVGTSPFRGYEDDLTHDLDSTYCVRNHSTTPQHQKNEQQQQLTAKVTKSGRKRGRPRKVPIVVEAVENSTDTDSDSQFGKILQIIERAPYELRIPEKNKNYSTGIRRKRRRTTTPKSRGKK